MHIKFKVTVALMSAVPLRFIACQLKLQQSISACLLALLREHSGILLGTLKRAVISTRGGCAEAISNAPWN